MAEVTLFGETFAVSDAEIPDLYMSELALAVADGDGMAFKAAVLRVVKTCILAVDWQRFRRAMVENNADDDALLDVIKSVTAARKGMEAVTGRPTERPSSSSDGPRVIEVSSTAGSSSPVIARLEKQGRPDLALMVDNAQRAQAG